MFRLHLWECWSGMGGGGSVVTLETTETVNVCQFGWKRKSKRDCCCGAGGGAWGRGRGPQQRALGGPPSAPPQLITAPLQHLHPVVFLPSGTLLQPAGWRECAKGGRVCWDAGPVQPSARPFTICPSVQPSPSSEGRTQL